MPAIFWLSKGHSELQYNDDEDVNVPTLPAYDGYVDIESYR
jgi:hypothetical protein